MTGRTLEEQSTLEILCTCGHPDHYHENSKGECVTSVGCECKSYKPEPVKKLADLGVMLGIYDTETLADVGIFLGATPMTTTPTRAQKRADLARAMGYRIEAQLFQGHIPYFELLSPQGDERVEPYEDESGINDLAATEEEAWEYAPDPFTDAEANRKLLEWLAGQLSPTGDESLMIRQFFLYLLTAVSARANEGKKLKDYNFGQRVLTAATMLHLLAAPPETIAEAAWRAIQEEAK